MTTKIHNQIGLEAEYFLLGKNDDILIPSKHGLPTDDFLILGEIRGLPGGTRQDTLSNFLNEYYRTLEIINNKNFKISLAGWTTISPPIYREVLKLMGNKEISTCQNIYGTDILEYSDSIIDKETGKLQGQKISCGLHVHFSSTISDRKSLKLSGDSFVPVKIPLTLGENVSANLNFYSKIEGVERETEVSSSVSRITKPVIKYIVESMDKLYKERYDIQEPLKFRLPGFYEIKPYGFEYRSLPFNDLTFFKLFDIVDYSFSLLEGL